MIEMLLVFSLATFVPSALVWFFVWAFWIHPNAAAYGPAPQGFTAAAVAEPPSPLLRRRLVWYYTVKRLTIALLITCVVLGVVALSGRAR